MYGPGWNAAFDAMLTMRPLPRSTMPGATRRVSCVSVSMFTRSRFEHHLLVGLGERRQLA